LDIYLKRSIRVSEKTSSAHQADQSQCDLFPPSKSLSSFSKTDPSESSVGGRFQNRPVRVESKPATFSLQICYRFESPLRVECHPAGVRHDQSWMVISRYLRKPPNGFELSSDRPNDNQSRNQMVPALSISLNALSETCFQTLSQCSTRLPGGSREKQSLRQRRIL
jgi:hypothetical protein